MLLDNPSTGQDPKTHQNSTKNSVNQSAPYSSVTHDMQTVPELVHDPSPELLHSILKKFPPHACVVCIGHEPHIGQTASLMVFGELSNGLSIKKAGAYLISFPTNVDTWKGHLEWWRTSAQLRTLRKGSMS